MNLKILSLTFVSCCCGSILVSYTEVAGVVGLGPFTVMTNIYSENSVKSFRETSILNSAWKVFTFDFNNSGKCLFIDTRLSFLGSSLENNDITFIHFMLQSKSCTKLFN